MSCAADWLGGVVVLSPCVNKHCAMRLTPNHANHSPTTKCVIRPNRPSTFTVVSNNSLYNSHAVLASLPLCPLSQEAPLDSCWPHSRQKAPSQIESKQHQWADESVSSWRRVAGYCIWWALFVHPTLEAQCQTPNAKHCQPPLPVTGPERI